jgi:uncharacterized protein YndB with AHSA1/START domain
MSDSTLNVKVEEIVITRIIDAPIELVWKAWTDPKQVTRWWGPKYYTSPSAKIDLRVGGRFVFSMLAPKDQGGLESFTTGIYKRIEPKRLLEFTQYLSDADGNPIDPGAIGMPADFPREILTVVTFTPKGKMTELSISEHGFTPGLMFIYAFAGMHQSLDKLVETLK